MFKNTRTGATATELRAYKSESKEGAQRRLEAAGWSFGGVDFTFDDSTKVFEIVKGVEEDKGPKDPREEED